MFSEMVKHLAEDGDKLQPHIVPLDGLSLMLILHGLMSMSNDMVHFENRSISLRDVEKGESSWTPWRRRMTEALDTWKAKYDAYIMANVQTMPESSVEEAISRKESIALLALYHTAHIVINSENRHLLAASGIKAIFGHIVTPADRQESLKWVEQWVRRHRASADHAAFHAAQMFREGLLQLQNFDANGVFHYPWCLVIGTLTCWAFHHFGAEDPEQITRCEHPAGLEMTQDQSQELMNHIVSLMASAFPPTIRRTLGKCCIHGLAMEVARYLKGVRWTSAYEAMRLLEGLAGTTSPWGVDHFQYRQLPG